MQPLKISNIKTIYSSDNQPISLVQGVPQNNFNIGVQPTNVMALVHYNESYKIGDIIDVNTKEISLLSELSDKQLHESWEVFGSDHTDGTLWYGKNEDMVSILEKIEKELTNITSHMSKEDIFEDECILFGQISFVHWNFSDDTTLIFLYANDEFNAAMFLDIIGKNVVNYSFGGWADDILCHEIISLLTSKLLKKIKIVGMEQYEDFFDDEDMDYTEEISINDKPPKKQDNELILSLSSHLFCSLMGWNSDTYGEEDQNMYIAKQLEKYNQIKQLQAPTSTHSERLVFTHENSNKEYNVELLNENNQWQVNVNYGSIGKPLKNENKIDTPNLIEAQKMFISILDEKLSKGYELDKSLTKKHKI